MQYKEKILQRFKLDEEKWPVVKRIIIGAAVALFLLVGFIYFYALELEKQKKSEQMSILPNRPVGDKNLEYDFIRVDTLAISKFKRSNEQPEDSEPEPVVPEEMPVVRKKKSTPKPVLTIKPVKTNPLATVGNRESNMIVMNDINEKKAVQSVPKAQKNKPLGAGAALVKVVLPQRTAIGNGSLVEARILRDTKWKNVEIPRRSKIIGVASLINRRINIDFREIIIEGDSRSCSARAYDNKRLQGIGYSPVSSETRRVLVEELRDAVSGVPVVGRYANRAATNSVLGQDVAQLDEGQEFYVLINSVF